MSVWPETFVVLKDNFKESLTDRVLTSNMDVGPAKKRRRTLLKSSTVSFSMYLSMEVYEQFKEFYFDNDFGVFDFKRPDNKKIVQARFSGVPSASVNETLWLVNVQLEIMP